MGMNESANVAVFSRECSSVQQQGFVGPPSASASSSSSSFFAFANSKG